jgi:hypothetical protein
MFISHIRYQVHHQVSMCIIVQSTDISTCQCSQDTTDSLHILSVQCHKSKRIVCQCSRGTTHYTLRHYSNGGPDRPQILDQIHRTNLPLRPYRNVMYLLTVTINQYDRSASLSQTQPVLICTGIVFDYAGSC